MSFGSVIVLLVLVEAVALLVAVRWLLVGVRSAAAPQPAIGPATQPAGALVVPPRSAPVTTRPVVTA